MSLYLTQCLHRTVQCQPERVATVFGSRQHSYRQYADRVARFAGALHKLGMAKGDRVGMLVSNRKWGGPGGIVPVCRKILQPWIIKPA